MIHEALINIHFAPKAHFFDPAVELDVGRQANGAHALQK